MPTKEEITKARARVLSLSKMRDKILSEEMEPLRKKQRAIQEEIDAAGAKMNVLKGEIKKVNEKLVPIDHKMTLLTRLLPDHRMSDDSIREILED